MDDSLKLPDRKPTMTLLAKLEPLTHFEFTTELLESLWDAYEVGELPENVTVLLRDWTARAYFIDSPVAQERIHHLQANGL